METSLNFIFISVPLGHFALISKFVGWLFLEFAFVFWGKSILSNVINLKELIIINSNELRFYFAICVESSENISN